MEIHLCEGEWDSRIKGQDDGFFEFTIDQVTGDITGRHVYSLFESYRVWGTCHHPDAADPKSIHSIDLWEPRSGFAYRFGGVITKDAGGAGRHKAKGTRRIIPGPPLSPPLSAERLRQMSALVPDDWEADKTT